MKHRKIKSALAACMLLLRLTGCGTAEPAGITAGNLTADVTVQTVAGAEADDKFLNAQTGFALRLLQETVTSKNGENVLISPYSVMQALAMAATGADGNTLIEMEQTLGGLPYDTLNSYLYTQRTTMPDSEGSRLKTANSVWFRDDEQRIRVLPEFLQNAADYFAADAYSAPFDETTRSDINNWCSNQTDGMIPELIKDKIPAEAVMYLINAVCFDAKWARPYEDDPRPRDFTAWNGQTQEAQMMYSDEHYYLIDEHAAGFLKYYRDGYAFIALLPEEGMSPETYLSGLTAASLRDVLVNTIPCDVQAGLPQFSYDFDIEYSGILKEMGMPSAFGGGADFSRMAQTATEKLYISRVLHKTHIDVDTEGTKAAAITALEMTDGADEVTEEPKYVILDRPFVYLIVETDTMLPVFAGVLNEIP